MSTRSSILCESSETANCHIWYDVIEPVVVISTYKGDKDITLNMDQVRELRDGLNKALEFWGPYLKMETHSEG